MHRQYFIYWSVSAFDMKSAVNIKSFVRPETNGKRIMTDEGTEEGRTPNGTS